MQQCWQPSWCYLALILNLRDRDGLGMCHTVVFDSYARSMSGSQTSVCLLRLQNDGSKVLAKQTFADMAVFMMVASGCCNLDVLHEPSKHTMREGIKIPLT